MVVHLFPVSGVLSSLTDVSFHNGGQGENALWAAGEFLVAIPCREKLEAKRIQSKMIHGFHSDRVLWQDFSSLILIFKFPLLG